MASVARITDIRGLVSLNDGEEILKEKDPISENGGILTISDFARIIFDDGREIEVQGPAQITLNENFFQTGEFDIQDVQVGDINLAQNIIENLATNLEGEGLLGNQAEGFVRTEQLDPSNINFGNNDIDFVLEDEEQILNPVTDAPAAGETPAAQDTDAGTENPEETTETPEETTETPEETIPESTTDVISEQTIDEDTKDSVVEQTVDAVAEDTTDKVVNVEAKDEQTVAEVPEATTAEETTDAVAENTVPENIVTDFVPESTVAETPETTTDEQTADVVSENTIDTVVTVPEQAEQTVDAVQEDTTDSIVNVSAQDEQTIAEIAEETTPESTNDVVTEQTTDEQTTAFILPHNFKTIF